MLHLLSESTQPPNCKGESILQDVKNLPLQQEQTQNHLAPATVSSTITSSLILQKAAKNLTQRSQKQPAFVSNKNDQNVNQINNLLLQSRLTNQEEENQQQVSNKKQETEQEKHQQCDNDDNDDMNDEDDAGVCGEENVVDNEMNLGSQTEFNDLEMMDGEDVDDCATVGYKERGEKIPVAISVADDLCSDLSDPLLLTEQHSVATTNKQGAVANQNTTNYQYQNGTTILGDQSSIGGGGPYNRKEKSLGELCRRFLILYGTAERGLLYLDLCTRELGVERRRIYDIINILESFNVIRRCAKNEYVWRGIDKIIDSIDYQIQLSLRGPAVTGNPSDRDLWNEFVARAADERARSASKKRGAEGKDLVENGADECDSPILPPSQSMAGYESQDSADDQSLAANSTKQRSRKGGKRVAKYKKVKSLGNFCQSFIRLFVSWKSVISLEEAAKQISDGTNFDEKILKTKIRRLYDIANVLQSIGLIEKTQTVEKQKKPAFKWIGLHGAKSSIQEIKREVRNSQKKRKSAGGIKNSTITSSTPNLQQQHMNPEEQVLRPSNLNNDESESRMLFPIKSASCVKPVLQLSKMKHSSLASLHISKKHLKMGGPDSGVLHHQHDTTLSKFSRSSLLADQEIEGVSQLRKGRKKGIPLPSPPRVMSPLRLKRRHSFVDTSPLKGSLAPLATNFQRQQDEMTGGNADSVVNNGGAGVIKIGGGAVLEGAKVDLLINNTNVEVVSTNCAKIHRKHPKRNSNGMEQEDQQSLEMNLQNLAANNQLRQEDHEQTQRRPVHVGKGEQGEGKINQNQSLNGEAEFSFDSASQVQQISASQKDGNLNIEKKGENQINEQKNNPKDCFQQKRSSESRKDSTLQQKELIKKDSHSSQFDKVKKNEHEFSKIADEKCDNLSFDGSCSRQMNFKLDQQDSTPIPGGETSTKRATPGLLKRSSTHNKDDEDVMNHDTAAVNISDFNFFPNHHIHNSSKQRPSTSNLSNSDSSKEEGCQGGDNEVEHFDTSTDLNRNGTKRAKSKLQAKMQKRVRKVTESNLQHAVFTSASNITMAADEENCYQNQLEEQSEDASLPLIRQQYTCKKGSSNKTTFAENVKMRKSVSLNVTQNQQDENGKDKLYKPENSSQFQPSVHYERSNQTLKNGRQNLSKAGKVSKIGLRRRGKENQTSSSSLSFLSQDRKKQLFQLRSFRFCLQALPQIQLLSSMLQNAKTTPTTGTATKTDTISTRETNSAILEQKQFHLTLKAAAKVAQESQLQKKIKQSKGNSESSSRLRKKQFRESKTTTV